MKKYLFILCFLTTIGTYAQSEFGVVAGLNYGDNGEIEYSDAANAGEDIYYGADSKVGYHFGLFFKAPLTENLYLRPEVLYTETKSSYNFDDEDAEYNVQKIDVPILLGYEILGPLHVFAGPSLQYISDHNLEGVTFGEVEDEFTVGAQFGLGVQLGSVGIDVRYERGLTENEAEIIDIEESLGGVQRIDARPNQFIVSLSLNF